ncbi:MAG: hypothetical protein ACPGQL_09765 [Thermoplasmatota archaeon]
MDERLPVRLGILLLPLSALAVAVTTPMRGEWLMPDDPGFSEWATSSGFAAWASASLNGTVWLVFGLLALAVALRLAAPRGLLVWGTFLALSGTLVFLPVTGFIAMAWPVAAEAHLAGDPGALAWLTAVHEGRIFQVWSLFAYVTFLAGFLLLAAAVWRAGWPRWTAVSFGVGAVAISFPWWEALELVGAAVYLVGCAGLAWRVWRPPAAAGMAD